MKQNKNLSKGHKTTPVTLDLGNFFYTINF